MGLDEERGPCDEKYHAPEVLIDAAHWDVYDVYSGFFFFRGPCDEKYHAPEVLIDAAHWDVYDVCVCVCAIVCNK